MIIWTYPPNESESELYDIFSLVGEKVHYNFMYMAAEI